MKKTVSFPISLSMSFLCALCLVLALSCFSGMAAAKNNKKHGPKHNRGQATITADKKAPLKIRESNRQAITSYIKKRQGKKCPPGLAKKNNGCQPPGQARKYSIGQPLPKDVSLSALQDDLLKQLYAAPVGHRYVQVEEDILLIHNATRRVIDAVTALSAAGK